jgi:hypothetical protein
MFAIRARRKVASERDFLDAVEKVVRQGTKFSSMYVFCSSFVADMLTNSNLIDHYIRCIIRPGGKTVIVHILPCAFNNGMPLLT